MSEFLVKMADERGHVLQQVESGVSEQEIRERFAQQGFMVYSVKSRRGLLPMGGKGSKKLLKADQFVIFNQQFLTLIKAGLPILKSLSILSKRQKDASFKAILENVQDRVKSGELLSQAFEAQGATSKIYTTTLLAGERSGNLEEVLGRYISFQRITVSFRKKLIASLWYPALLVVALTVMLTFLMTYVVPQFADLYSSLNAKLPAITIVMLNIGKGIQQYYYIIIGALLALGIGITMWVRSDRGSKFMDSIRYRLPLFGEIWMKYQIAMFSRTLSTLLTGGLPLVPSLETASQSINSFKIASNVEYASKRVREGRALSFSLEETQFFPDLAVEMIEVGESTGALPAMLNSVAEFYEEDVQNSLATAMQLVEPVILIFMGITVAVVLLSLYLPIFSLGAQIQQ
ncbi:MAG TPA: type II secretion system F family protein [Candidatus Angelobacter sp.]|jgi:type IV pilus assembly protein PilC|nr:type II secretion system F family protein [Candidatus Angelobacter sp.]